jgi:hypothetical protein
MWKIPTVFPGVEMMQNITVQTLLQCLKACEKNYAAHVREHGKLDQADIALWKSGLSDLTPLQIQDGFDHHIKTSKWFPTVADVRGGLGQRKVADDWDKAMGITWDPMYELVEGEKKIKPMTNEQKVRLNKLMEDAKQSLKKTHGRGNKTGPTMAG